MFVQALITEAPIGGLDIGVLVGLARFNLPQRHGVRMGPGPHGVSTKLLPIVGPNHLGQATSRGQLIELPLISQTPP